MSFTSRLWSKFARGFVRGKVVRRSSRLSLSQLEARDVPALITVINSLDSGAGSFRQAVLDANSVAFPGQDTIDFNMSLVTSPISLSTGQVAITSDLIINGPGAGLLTIQNTAAAGTTSRVLNITGGPVVISGLTFSGGNSTTSGGAGIRFTTQTVTLNNVVVSGNKTSTAAGGGVYFSSGTLNLNNSTISGNSTTGTGDGGGVRFSTGKLNLTNSTIDANSAGIGANAQGGGVFISSTGTMTAVDSTISGNSAGGDGGAIYTFSGGIVNLNRSTVNANVGNVFQISANLGGGGISLFGGSATIVNSTVSGNKSMLGAGGGILSYGTTTNVRNSTVAFNDASAKNGGGIFVFSGTTNLSSTIVSNNTASTNPDVSGTVANGNESLISNDTGTTITTQTGMVLNMDPLLAPLANNGGPTKTHLPGVGPAINAGNNTFALTVDQRGLPRVQGANADIGSVETPDPAPIAISTPTNVSVAGGTVYSLVVNYTDDVGIDTSSIDINDISISGPGGALTAIAASFVGAGKAVTATYDFTPPGGSWDAADPGLYTVSMNASQVSDVDGITHFVPAGTLGKFLVAFPPNFVVDVTNDVDDGNYSTGNLSLREAVTLSNGFAGPDVITFDAGVFGAPQTITLTSKLPLLSDAVTINGTSAANVTINGGLLGSVFVIDAPGSANAFNFSKMTITGGKSAVDGGGINIIDEAVTLTNVVITGNEAALDGGGINLVSAAGSINLTDSVISGNKATGSQGGGVYIQANSVLTVVRSTVSGNSAGEDGGGIYFFNGGTLNMDDSTVSGNVANVTTSGAGGGGFYLWNVTATIRNSTIAGNTAKTAGGGIGTFSGTGPSIFSSTIANNSTTGNGGGIGGNAATLDSVIVSGNTATGTGPDVNGTVNANFSLLGNSAGATVLGANNLLDVNPLLGALANNGGPTQTMSLGLGSPAVNVGNKVGAPVNDQRGVARDKRPDIGAFEYNTFVESLVVTITADEDNGTSDPGFGTGTSLREALAWADANPGADVVTFGALFAAPQTITLGGTQFETLVNPGLSTVAGTGVNNLTISGGGLSRIFDVGAFASLAVNDVTLTGGAAANGGAIQTAGSASVSTSAVVGNSGTDGGAVAILLGGSFSSTGSFYSGNNATNDGGAWHNAGTASSTNDTFNANGALNVGGAVANVLGTFNSLNSTISGNTAVGGSGVSNSGSFNATNTVVAGNVGSDVAGLVNSNVNSVVNMSAFNAGLGPIANYGGQFPTIPLLPGSPAIDIGVGGPATDNRGLGRVGATDAGSFESQGFMVANCGGGGQTAQVNTAFANPLCAMVTANNPVEPVNGGKVHFQGPDCGAGINPASLDPVISGGIANANVTANGLTGKYDVVANVGASSTSYNLENTQTPGSDAGSVVSANAGNLSVFGSNIPSFIDVIHNGGGFVDVYINAVYKGVFSVTGTGAVTVVGGSGNDTITVTTASGTSYPGLVSVDGKGGNDIIRVYAYGSGNINGRLALIGGTGDDTMTVGESGSLTVFGISTFDGGTGSDTLDVGCSDGSVALKSSTSLTNVNTFRSNSPTVGGTIFDGTFQMISASEALNAVFAPRNSFFGSSVTITTGSGSDDLSLGANNTVVGALTMAASTGANKFAPASSNLFIGDVNFSATTGDDSVTMAGVFGANVTLTLGDGNNNVSDTGTTIARNWFITAGAGNDNVVMTSNAGQKITVNLGNGTNNADIASDCTRLTYAGGLGADNVIVRGFHSYLLNVNLNAGNDTFTFAPGAGIGSGTIDFGPGADTYIPNGVFVGGSLTLFNLP